MMARIAIAMHGVRTCGASALIVLSLTLSGALIVRISPVAAATQISSADSGAFTRSEPEKKRFVLTVNYPYRERVYDPPVLLKKQAVKPEDVFAVEDLLRSYISAMKNLDFDWWLDTWMEDERSTVLKRMAAAGKTRDDVIAEWKKNIVGASVTMERWIITRTYIILTYKIKKQDTEDKNKYTSSKEIPVVFKIANLRWNVTNKLENDPVVLYFDAKKSRIERVIR